MHWHTILSIICIAAAIFILANYATAAPVTIHDGDTVTIAGEKIRLWGIDAPENDQPAGTASRMALAALVMNAGDTLRIARRGVPDRYGRTLAILYAGRKSINAAMVEAGHAWAYSAYSTVYEQHQLRAYKARLGLWANVAPSCRIPPWDWRRGYRC